MATKVKRVAVIGAGASGLPATKTCLDEELEPVCFERTDEVGGLWRFTEKVVEGQSCVMKSTCSNTSKEMSCYSDFPMPKEFPLFMPHSVVQKYYRLYADNFKLDKYIRYNTEVTSVRRADDYAETGRWVVESVDHKTGQKKCEVFDAVMMCSGHHADKHVPSFPGLDQFQGPIIHTHDYRPSSELVGKKILVVGLGNSGGDVASELGIFNEVFLSTRRGTWVLQTIGARGMPWDMVLNTRWMKFKASMMPLSWVCAMMSAYLNVKLHHDLYGLTPECSPLGHSPFANDELAYRMACGRVHLKGDIKRFTKDAVEFQDGTVQKIDMVVMATGYIIGFPIIEKEAVDIKDNRVRFYKMIFPPYLEHPTLAFIGCIQPFGCIWPIAEMQSRVATRVFKGLVKLPPRQAMWEEIQKREEMRSKLYPNSLRHTIEADWIPVLDDLADMIGCKPSIPRLMLTDPVLGWKVLFGPCHPYQYRLLGPGKWSGAREAIMTAMDRVRHPFQSRQLPANRGVLSTKMAEWAFFSSGPLILLLEMAIVGLLLYMFLK